MKYRDLIPAGIIAIIAAVLALAQPAFALVSYPPGSLLQPSDVATSTIRDFAVTPSKIASDEDFSFHGASSTNATSTYATTTTLAVTSGSTRLNGVPYTWPSSQGGSGNQLQDDGTGVLSWALPSSQVLAKQYTTGEALTAGMPVYIADGTLNESTTTNTLFNTTYAANLNFGDTSATQKMAFSFTVSQATAPTLLSTKLYSGGSPTDNATFAIQSDSAGSPSGTSLYTASVAGTGISNSGTAISVALTGSGTLQTSTTYWLVFGRSSSVNGSNYYKVQQCTSACSSSNYSAYNGSTWSASSGSLYQATIYQAIAQISGEVYQASANTTGRYLNYIGLADGTYATGTPANIDVAGIVSGMSGLTAGTNYYVSNTLGTLGTSAGGNTVKSCHALSTTECLLTFIW
ncbi:MAG: hypothetical protein ACREGR_00415 [Minisyncoccia bacterium]